MGSFVKNFINGIVVTNPVFVLLLGLCPALAVSTSLENGIGMSGAVMFVLLGSNIIIALIRKWVPNTVRIPVFIVVIATFVTIVELFMKAYFPPLAQSLGIYVPLIVVNCIILGRAEAFASKNKLTDSIADALGIGVGFAFAIMMISLVREVLGGGTLVLFEYEVFRIPGFADNPISIFILPMGAFLVIGLMLALFRHVGVMENE